MYVSEAGLLYTSGLFITNKMFLDFRIVTLVTLCTGFKPAEKENNFSNKFYFI